MATIPQRVKNAIKASWQALDDSQEWWPNSPATQALFPLLNTVAYLVGHVEYLENRIAQLELQAVPTPITPPIEDPVILPALTAPADSPTPSPVIPDTPVDPLVTPGLAGTVVGVTK